MLGLLGKDSPNDNINGENARIETDLTGEKKNAPFGRRCWILIIFFFTYSHFFVGAAAAAVAAAGVCLFATYSFKLFLLISVWETAICEFSVYVSALLTE